MFYAHLLFRIGGSKEVGALSLIMFNLQNNVPENGKKI